ncbi:MAG: phosphatidylinositol-specific phospholipase C1-like protein [Deltaproteobacteria bacterium]|nr:phosphatidylinositol-specific phospholipase C1-like protein [Deltaproteobacteria bacterium]
MTSALSPARRALLAAAFALGAASTPARAAFTCAGDCNGDRAVTVDELMRGVALTLDPSTASACRPADVDGDGVVFVNEVLDAVGQALDGCPAYPYARDEELRLNQIQVLASHNSYHQRVDQLVFDQIAMFSQALADTLDYGHRPLPEQFEEHGVRAIELDVFADPDGGLFASPLGLRLLENDPNATLPGMSDPGFKVLHVQDIDFRSSCGTFVGCLQQVKAWSDAHPGHVPLMIQVEAKDDALPNVGGFVFVVPKPIGDAELDALDAEIRSVFGAEQLITPDDVRGARATLEEAVRLDGWPTLAASRGKVFFTLDNGGRVRDAYIAQHPGLVGRVLFVDAEPPAAEAGFVKLNDPIADFDHIQDVVARGFIVRTRADADTTQSRTGDTTQRQRALDSGAQFVSTDYEVPDPRFTDYAVAIPDGTPARCNPISAPQDCTPADVERPDALR